MEKLQEVTAEEWDETAEMVKEKVRAAARQEEGVSVLGAVLAELEEPTSDFVNAVVQRLIS